MTQKKENRITARLREDRKLLLAYYMPEFPVAGSTLPVLEALQDGGADIIELGIPFSDPVGDGPVIQNAAHIAIRNGVSVRSLLELVRKARAGEGCRKITVPILLMGYSNPLIAYGGDCFLHDAVKAGVDGLLIPDLPPEESADFLQRAKSLGLTVVYLISPVTPPERIEWIDSLSTDFSYCLAVNATTGTAKLADASTEASVDRYLERVRLHARKKFVVGFGIRDRARVEHMWRLADGAVVGTALLEHIAGAPNPGEAARRAGEFWRGLR
ncbi:tryptophan synthase subunit alpha [Pelodictyon luteolum]|uniref:Tryptophan synthase alpha chain n=1 Tax=Chlorobium luteolum (strain DSM 273 / BCRC 81028 / 2530) TaxID=319225 RepID=TRPA_CHLL3|nr:tryptophan synthase subunit alpha [Pelodictyon luteolum]Q3B5F2.1 RecName: Full=Tryptophan synthase alpha chain [Pelodictyon luteolum DSM 273]ABB23429.1 tryptophan synthase, alpha chain [Pelodictyon luteolum DSM 273]